MRTTALILLLTGLLIGCQQPQRADLETPRLDDGPTVDHLGQSRSLAFSSPQLRTLRERQGVVEGVPWYAARSDERLAADAGIRTPVLLYSETVTIDRQSTYGGRPRNHLRDTTYRGRVIQGVR